ncbi:Putative RNA polymerase III Rpc82, C -terminal, winged helix-like DNA-binding domain superfamily [Septoria linicola]|uniref:DNA-directed RNA polymerase III subunit RPC3 n=1 Tax=Septoria linicola TaxID=215465 RepID=A0A9Q9EJG8_9PEZI|nr:putative RNA polymerase III Rpc82, C -terminal, winged helix-like DNA-binding domain superfamily [Septoria linicola]USW53010.1 Putative RNA polymerase III Rpc82, C -terminal, winged helix-like DNA-binding domain superfamily [Septoria linicola]
MSKRLQELCALVVDDTCGHLASQIFSILAQKGRHTVFELRRELPHITLRQMRQALVTLLQQHIILYHQVDDGPTYYHADWRNPARSIRAALIAVLVAERHGDGAAKIVTNLLQLGHARVGDLAQAFDFTPTSKRDSGYESCNGHVNGAAKVNGVSALDAHKVKGDKIVSVGQFHNTLRSLLNEGVLVKRGKQNYMPAADLQAQIEAIVLSEQFPDGKINGAKKQSEFQAAVKTLKRKRQEANEYSASRDNDSRGQIKRPGMTNPAVKRAKLNGGLPNGVHHDDDLDMDESVPKLPSDLILSVNFAQYPITQRSQRLEQFAEAALGGVTATVYAALLRALESKIRARDDDFHEEQDSEDQEARLPSATTTEIAEVLKTWTPVDLTMGISGAAAMYKKPEAERDKSKKGKKRTVPDEDWGDIGIKMELESEDDEEETQPANGFTSYRDQNKMLSLVDEHLKLLTEHPQTFCRRVGAGGRGEWKVDFGNLTNSLIAREIDETVKSRLSKVHAMIVRMLRDVGRLEDKEIAARLMMRVKDVRSILTQLQFAGLVEGQEVPKDNSRQPSRAVYLWYHDQTRVAGLLLQQSYQGMSRILQRLASQRESSRGIIEKAEMMNTKEESLSQVERDHLMHWREIEERLLTQFLRLDEHVALLRDFSGKDTSLVS